MRWIFGIDEAGYGPNLGPLCLGFSGWEVDGLEDVPAWQSALSPSFQPRPPRNPWGWIPLGDSKILHAPGRSGSLLKEAVEVFLDLANRLAAQHTADNSAAPTPSPTEKPSGIWSALLPDHDQNTLQSMPWYASIAPEEEAIPTICSVRTETLMEGARDSLTRLGVQRLVLSARAMEAKAFNREVERLGNKAHVLTSASLELLRGQLERLAAESSRLPSSIELWCDKHGGRQRYASALQHQFPDCWWTPLKEHPDCSQYRSTWKGIPIEIRFLAKGDSLVPIGLASMIAKTIRELAMARWNHYWCSEISDLKPTAGYPLDARRFADRIEAEAMLQGWTPQDWWRQV
ncbi:MAG: hypothetical protein ACK5ZC_00140 [Pirellulaceae bacterium]